MVSDFLDAPRVVERLRCGPAGAYVDEFAAWLATAGYKRTAARGLIRGLERFGHWVSRKGLDLGKLDSDDIVSVPQVPWRASEGESTAAGNRPRT